MRFGPRVEFYFYKGGIRKVIRHIQERYIGWNKWHMKNEYEKLFTYFLVWIDSDSSLPGNFGTWRAKLIEERLKLSACQEKDPLSLFTIW